MDKQIKKRWFESFALDGAFWLAMDNIGWLVAEFFLYGTTLCSPFQFRQTCGERFLRHSVWI